MTALFALFAAVGVPLVAWFLLAGDGSDGGDAGGGDSGGVGGIMLRLFPLSTLAIAAATFGVTGLALGAIGTGAPATLLWAIVIAVLAGALNTALFGYIRRSDSGGSLSDDQLAGAIGRVVLPIPAAGRGRVAVSVNDQELYLSAEALPTHDGRPGPDSASTDLAPVELAVGDPILVVQIREGVAEVIPLDPDLT